MPTVAEVLKSAGMTDEQITAIDQKAVEGFTRIISGAEAAQLAGENERRAAHQMYEQTITPALNDWANREANITAERDYYKRLAEGAKNGGFVPDVAPFQAPNPQNQQRDITGRYVANANPVPGSPNLQEFESKIGSALGNLADLQWRYRKLYGSEMPDSPTALNAEASQNRMTLPEWAERKYKFSDREQTLAAEEKKKEQDAIRKEERDSVTREFTEKYGSNPNLRQAAPSRFSELRKGVTEGTRPDPLKMTPAQRSEATRQAIQQDLADRGATIH